MIIFIQSVIGTIINLKVIYLINQLIIKPLKR